MTFHNRAWKETEVKEIQELINSKAVVAVVDLNLLPAALFAGLRKKLANNATFKVSKTKVTRLAFENIGEKKVLKEFVGKSCGLIFTDMNPFELYAFLKKNKGNVSAKEGKIADEDILIPAGDTGLPPGPALSDLKAAGLEVRVQGATIAITKDKVVTKKGEAVSKPVAGTLSKLDIRPVKIGLKLIAAYENGEVFKGDVLDIDTDKVFEDFVSAHKKAFNLAINSEVFTEQTNLLLISKAFNNAKTVALEFNIYNKVTMPILMAKANLQANALKANMPEEKAVESEKTEETSDESKKDSSEEKSAEKKEESAEEKKEISSEEKTEEKAVEKKVDSTEEKKENA